MDTDQTTDTGAPETEHVESTDTSTETADQGLGDAGRKALESERAARKAAEKQLKAMQTELETTREASLSEAEKAIATARREARAEALTEVNARVIRAEARALATGKLADPNDIENFIDLRGFEVDDEGHVNAKAITKAIDDLIKSKPYLAAQRVGGDADAGARGAAPSNKGDMNSLIRRAAGLA
jgi:hypothetical protein